MNNNATSCMEYFDIHTHTPAREHSIYDSGTLYVPDMTISVGIHPWHIPAEWEETFAAIEAVAAEKNVVAIGECGIDKLRGAAETEIQKKVFLAHATLAEKVRKPMIVHCVKSFDEIIEIRKQMSPSQAWIIHGFRGKPQQARQLTGAGLYLSLGEHFNPMSAKAVPLDRLFVESDESQRPISEIYGSIAGAKGMTAEELVSAIRGNTTIFGQF